MSRGVSIGTYCVGPNNPCFVIAEVAQAHDGSLGAAHAYVDAVARAGVSAVKFQTHIASAESTASEPFRVGGFPQDSSRYAYWERMQFTDEQWAGLADHAREAGLVFLSSPFSMEAVELLDQIGMPAWKIGSGEVNNEALLRCVAATRKPVLLSSGMASWAELDRAVGTITEARAPFAVLQCTSSYPCAPEGIGLNVLSQLRDRYHCPVGLSDHSGTMFPGLAAVALGANLLELHVVWSRGCFGPDVESSVTTDELAGLVEGVRFIERALTSEVEKDEMAHSLEETKRLFGRSVVARNALPKDHVITDQDLSVKKPGFGIPAEELHRLIGRRTQKAYSVDEPIDESELRGE